MSLAEEIAERENKEWNERHRRYKADLAEKYGLVEIDILFDGPPGPVAGRFIDCHDAVTGESVSWGRWLDNRDGTWSLCGIVVPALGEGTEG